MELKLILQLAGVLLGLLYLWLEYRADIRLWVVGLVMPLVHGTLYFESGLYADASMQVYYVLAGLYGWAVWSKARRRSAGTLPSPVGNDVPADAPDAVRTDRVAGKGFGSAAKPAAASAGKASAALRIAHTPLRRVPALAAVYLAAHAALYFLLLRFTNSTVPFWDAMTTAASIVAMWMLARKYAEQWLVWLAVDLVTVGLYLYKGIPLTAGLYALYSVLAVAGYLRWRKLMRTAA